MREHIVCRPEVSLAGLSGAEASREVLTTHFFMTYPGYLEWMLKLKDVRLRI